MNNFNFGLQYNPINGGRLIRGSVKDGTYNSPNRFYYEAHLYVPSSGDTLERNYLSLSSENNIPTSLSINVVGRDNPSMSEVRLTWVDLNVPVNRINFNSYVTMRLIKDRNTGQVFLEFDSGDGQGVIDYGEISPDAYIPMFNYIFSFDSWLQLGALFVGVDYGSGWQLLSKYDPNLVPNDEGDLVARNDPAAVPESNRRIYNTLDISEYYEIENSDAENVFNPVYDVVSVNGGSIELGTTDFTVELSNPVNVTDLYFQKDDGTGSTYHPTFSVSDVTIAGSIPITSDDTIPIFGSMVMYVETDQGVYSKRFDFLPPSEMTLIELGAPIELNESSYTYGTNLSPTVGDYYFHAPTDDFSITGVADTTHPSNVFLPVGDAPWSHTVWYLSGAGLRETEVSDGQVIVDPNTPPTVDAGAPRSITVPDTVELGTNVTASDSDGSIASYAWTQESGPNVTINNAGVKNASVSLTDAGTYVFRVTVTDNDGAEAFDDLTVTANEAVTDSTLNLTVRGIGSSTEQVVLHDRADNSVVYTGNITFTNDVGSVTLTGVDVGTEVYGVWFGTNPPVTGTGVYGVTE